MLLGLKNWDKSENVSMECRQFLLGLAKDTSVERDYLISLMELLNQDRIFQPLKNPHEYGKRSP